MSLSWVHGTCTSLLISHSAALPESLLQVEWFLSGCCSLWRPKTWSAALSSLSLPWGIGILLWALLFCSLISSFLNCPLFRYYLAVVVFFYMDNMALQLVHEVFWDWVLSCRNSQLWLMCCLKSYCLFDEKDESGVGEFVWFNVNPICEAFLYSQRHQSGTPAFFLFCLLLLYFTYEWSISAVIL